MRRRYEVTLTVLLAALDACSNGGRAASLGGSGGENPVEGGSSATGGSAWSGSDGQTVDTGGQTMGTGSSWAGMSGSIGTGGQTSTGDTGVGGADDGGIADTGTSGGDVGGNINPCPAEGIVCAVMPLGDSITEGYQSSGPGGGYRPALFQLALEDDKSITFVGSAPLNGPDTVDGVAFPKQNEGVSGRTIAAIAALIPTTISANKPNIILLHIGTNDFTLGPLNMDKQLGQLIDKIVAAAPDALLIVARIIPCKTDSINTGTIEPYNDAMPAMVAARAGAGKHVILVDMYGAFTANADYKDALLYDDTHPQDVGYSLMASVWYTAVKPYLP